MSFVFYDTETTGTHTAFDQILQFGAIRTDHELNELERFEIRCQLLPYVIPSPGAMRVTGVTVTQLTDTALPTHYQMVRAILAKMEEWSPAVFIGHNSLGFDEHLLRQAFYKTLHPPYLTNTNGNCRTDSLRMIQAVARFAPDVLTIPFNDRGRPVFKLDRLAPANGFDHSNAHDAMADVEATIHMCRLIAERVPDYWSGFVRFAQKAAVTDFANEEEVFALTDFYFGKPYSWIVTSIGTNPDNGSELLVFDLSLDPVDLADMSDADLVARLAERPKPVRGMKCNAGPIVLPYDDAPEEVRASMPELDELRRRATYLKNDGLFCERLVSALLQTREERERSIHVEEQIYHGFADRDDTALMERFHGVEWHERTPLISQLVDGRLRSLGQRLIYCEAPHVMKESERLEYDVAIARRLLADADSVPWLTLSKAMQETDDLLAGSSGDGGQLLTEFQEFLRRRFDEAGSLLA